MLSEEEQKSDTAAFKAFVKQYFKLILVYAIVGGVLGFVITFFIPKEFRSVGTVFAPMAPSIELSIDNPNFGYDVEADRLIQILQSNEVRDSVIRSFDLTKVYNIDKNDADWLDRLIKQYKKDITFERTPSMSVLITAQSHSATLSSDMVNYIIRTADQIREKLYKQNILLAYQSALHDFNAQKNKTDSVQTILIGSLKANNLNSLLLLASNAQISIDIDKLNSLAAKNDNVAIGSEIITYKNMRDRLNESELRLIRVQKSLNNPVPKLYVIDKAEPRFKKVYPSGLISIAFGILFSVTTLIVVLLVKRFFESN